MWGGAGLGRVGAPGSEASESNCGKDALSPLSRCRQGHRGPEGKAQNGSSVETGLCISPVNRQSVIIFHAFHQVQRKMEVR